jgi:hypothetical protein
VPARLIRRQSCGCRRNEPDPPPADDPRADLPRDALARDMAEAAFPEARHTMVDELEDRCRLIVHALRESIERADERPLHDAVTRLLAETESRGEDAHVWQAAVSALYARSSLFLERVPAVDQRWFLGLLDHARLEISEQVQRRTTHALLEHVDMMSQRSSSRPGT